MKPPLLDIKIRSCFFTSDSPAGTPTAGAGPTAALFDSPSSSIRRFYSRIDGKNRGLSFFPFGLTLHAHVRKKIDHNFDAGV